MSKDEYRVQGGEHLAEKFPDLREAIGRVAFIVDGEIFNCVAVEGIELIMQRDAGIPIIRTRDATDEFVNP